MLPAAAGDPFAAGVALAAVSALAIRPAFGSARDTGMVTSPDPADGAVS